jgi:ureidoglycolate lyase
VRQLILEPLTAKAFAPFGDVIDGQTPCEQYPINEGLTQRHNALAAIDCSANGGTGALSLFRAQAIESGFVLRSMERHPLGSQAFINTSGNPYAVVVAPAGDFNETAIRGFLAAGDQSISYHRGTWHHFLLALGGVSDFVVVDRIGPGDNCDEYTLQSPMQLSLSSAPSAP